MQHATSPAESPTPPSSFQALARNLERLLFRRSSLSVGTVVPALRMKPAADRCPDFEHTIPAFTWHTQIPDTRPDATLR